MEKKEPKYKVGDWVRFEFDGSTWIGEITELYWFPIGWNYKIYGFWHNESDVLRKEE